MGAYHPECPQRLKAIEDNLFASGLMNQLQQYEAPRATVDQLADNKDVRAALVEPKEDKFQKSIEPLQKKFAFSPRQWVIVGILIAATVFVLFVFMLIIILSL